MGCNLLMLFESKKEIKRFWPTSKNISYRKKQKEEIEKTAKLKACLFQENQNERNPFK